jgi:hypothetical protein
MAIPKRKLPRVVASIQNEPQRIKIGDQVAEKRDFAGEYESATKEKNEQNDNRESENIRPSAGAAISLNHPQISRYTRMTFEVTGE